MRGARAWTWVPVVVGVLVAGVGGCGGDDEPDRVVLNGMAEWRQDPGSLAEVGYHLQPDVSFIDRAGDCAHIPKGLRVTVNDIEATPIGRRAACDVDGLFDAGPFTTPEPVTVRAFDGDRLLGEATYEGLFWGLQAGLVSPPDGQVRPGDQVVVSVPPGKERPTQPYADWYWLGTAPSVPPFFTTSATVLSADGSTITATVPDISGLSGPVALALRHGYFDRPPATPCAGFIYCAISAWYALGPIPLTVLAP